MEDEGTNAEVTGRPIFKILAGRNTLTCHREGDLVNSASVTSGRKDLHQKLCTATTSAATGTKAEVIGGSDPRPISLHDMLPLAHLYDPNDIWDELCIVEGRMFLNVRYRQPRVRSRPHDHDPRSKTMPSDQKLPL
ncbi:hypothetical protein QVD17_26415 [Tagetes erecta]|uniref:Uncharacterized protein n=1 Tax=Tagetes erecta TaxID=13708 RepID=A0AAD8NQ41_TARER|nr:hypothetical protein QVD17_26415 [Tagetes erecta]